MNIQITGSSGFVGQNLVKHFQKEKYNIFETSLREVNWKDKLIQNADAIIHLAGIAHDTHKVIEPEKYFEVNRDLTIQLFNLFIQSNIKDFIFFSSVKAVADETNKTLTEETKPNPKTPYGKSKHEAESYMLSQLIPNGKRLFIIRPCMIHGPGNKGNLNLLYKLVKNNIPWFLGAFENKRSFLGIDNLCYLTSEFLTNKKIESGIYNFADDEFISTNELINLMSQSLGRKSSVLKVNQKAIKLLSKMGDTLKLPINSERLKKLTESYVVSNEKIKSVLEIDHLPFSTKEGLIKTFTSFKNIN